MFSPLYEAIYKQFMESEKHDWVQIHPMHWCVFPNVACSVWYMCIRNVSRWYVSNITIFFNKYILFSLVITVLHFLFIAPVPGFCCFYVEVLFHVNWNYLCTRQISVCSCRTDIILYQKQSCNEYHQEREEIFVPKRVKHLCCKQWKWKIDST